MADVALIELADTKLDDTPEFNWNPSIYALATVTEIGSETPNGGSEGPGPIKPCNIGEAQTTPEWPRWLGAMNEEINQLTHFQTLGPGETTNGHKHNWMLMGIQAEMRCSWKNNKV